MKTSVETKPGSISGRVPPNDLDAEAAVVSAVLLQPEVLPDVREVVAADHFYSDANRNIYRAMEELADENRPVDILTVRSWLADHGLLDRSGGPAYLARILDSVPSVANVVDYASVVRQKSRLRQCILTCQKTMAEAYTGSIDDVQEFLDVFELEVFRLTEDKAATVELVSAGTVMSKCAALLAERCATEDNLVGCTTGLTSLDNMLGGLQPGDLTVIAARPGVGKTALGTHIACAAAESGAGTALFSLEMPMDQLGARLGCAASCVPINLIKTPRYLLSTQKRAILGAWNTIAKLPLELSDQAEVSANSIRAACRRSKTRARMSGYELRLVVIDYLQLMDTVKSKNKNREQEVAEVSRACKLLAKQLDVHVVLLAQLNRASEGRKDRRPQLSDLRESGAIEQDADNVILLYREDYYDKKKVDAKNLCELIVAKQRNGPTGTTIVRFDETCGRFDNLSREKESP